jgi:iron complex transport system ATP-binding protein
MSQLKAENISFAYSGNAVLKNFSFGLPKESITGIIGGNGAGKSTALKLLSGYLKPSNGKVILNNRNISKIKGYKRAEKIAIVSQNIFSPLPFTVKQVVQMGRTARVSKFSLFSKYDKEAVENAMEEMDIANFAEKKFSELSGGEKQRVKIAAALAQEPEILLLDEPTSQLDIGHSIQLIKNLLKLKKEYKLSILLVSHDIQLICACCEKILILKNGQVLAEGPKRQVITSENINQAYNTDLKIEITENGEFISYLRSS